MFLCFRWLMMGIIGFSVGIVGFLLHQIIDIISEFKWELTSHYIQVNRTSSRQHKLSRKCFCQKKIREELTMSSEERD